MSGAIDILMPLEQEGSKSVIRAWLKKPGDAVKQDEPLVELETDKVAVEVPAPADGVLASIALNEGDEAPPGAKLGVLNVGATPAVIPDARSAIRDPGGDKAEHLPLGPGSTAPRASGRDAGREMRLSPLVKRLLAEHRLSPEHISGTGRDGRITHQDVEAFLSSPASRSRSERASQGRDRVATPGGSVARAARDEGGAALVNTKIPHNAMRRAIADHMSRSVAVAPHVTAVFEADFSAIAAHRAKHKDAYSKAGAPLTYSAYIVRAAAEAMKAAPAVNSRWHDDHLELFADANIGMGVALGDKGLIVPVVKRAQALSLRETAAALGDLTDRARRNALKPADVQGGTFTISNHGVSGSLVAAPIIINQPQSAILGIGKLEKRVVVREVNGADAILVRPMAYVSLTIDHRVLDGHQTNAWLTRFVEILETWPTED
ncbi:dihydrolipoamide acyltransferase component [alpha proteobacterium U9-1i]|nr:dihydrolipoamide acyltransferase component [alpha proteobacterium U9-1i]